MKSAGKARNNGLYRHIRTSKEIIRNLLNDYYKYLIDENNRTVSLVNTIPVDYSGYVSSVQELDNNIIIDSGMAMSWGEYDQFGTLIKKFTTTGGKFVYRVFKYDYNDYWFQ